MKLSDFWLSRVPKKDQGTTDNGATPLFIAAEQGHLEVVRFLVESGAKKRPRHDRQWSNASCYSSLSRGTLKLFDFWLSPVPKKTNIGQMMEQRLFAEQLTEGTLKLSDFWLSRVPTKTKALTDTGSTPIFIAAEQRPP